MPNQKILSPPPEVEAHWLNSLKKQRAILWKNLAGRLETKAQYGLEVPTKIENEIDHLRDEIERVEIGIAELESPASPTLSKGLCV